ncbi:MAG: hypothetical protein AAB338_00355 [Patescibacteria group bacterium]|mgnify:FL=1
MNQQLNNLSREVNMIRSFIIGIAGKDPEGEYRSEFVKRLKKAALEKPMYNYTGKGSLFKLIKKTK